MSFAHQATRRSVIGSFFASIAAGVAALFTAAPASANPSARQTNTNERVKRTSSDTQKPGAKPPLFSSWTTYGDLVFIAGKGHHSGNDITVHTTSVLDQVEAELKRAGSSMDKVLKVNVYLNDLKDYDAMNAVFRGRFGPNPPVRTTVACAGGIPGNSLVEIDCIATR
jgi:2-iminobutanoate/2-iminopropanoate deaminase